MNKRLLSVLIFAAVVSAGASYVLYRMISVQLAASAKVGGGKLLVATHNLDAGALIKDGDVKIAEWSGSIPPDAITKPEDAINRGVVNPIFEGEPIVENRVAARGAGAGLAAIIPPGKRAVAVRVNDVTGVAGFIAPGTHIDLLIAGTPPGESSEHGTVTKTLMQDIEVLSAGQNIQKDAEGKPVNVAVVNLLATPEQAEVLSLASNETRIQFVLRNPTDKEIAKTPGTNIGYLFNGRPDETAKPPVKRVAVAKPAPPPPPPAPAPVAEVKPEVPITVEMIHGSAKTETKFKPEEDTSSEAKPE